MIKLRTAVAGLVLAASTLATVWVQEGGSKDKAYLDSGGVPTIGPGRTEGVKMGDKTNNVREMILLLDNLEHKYAAAVRRCITVPLYQNEFDALVDTAYNAGTGAFCRELAPVFNTARTDADYAAACRYIATWRITVNGQDCRIKKNNCRGLVIRRAEAADKCEGRG
jgi:lysozyme